MAGNANSGRRPKRIEERRLIGKHFTEAVSVVAGLMNDLETPRHISLDAARVFIEQHIGKPKQRLEAEHMGEGGGPVRFVIGGNGNNGD